MGFSSNVNLFACDTIFSLAKEKLHYGWYEDWYKLLIVLIVVMITGVLLSLFLNTRIGLSIRATGDTKIWCGLPASIHCL